MYGGAIFSESERPSGGVLDKVNFTNNTVADGGNGNDIADNSIVGIRSYSSNTVRNCQSTRAISTVVSNFFLLQGSLIFDCLFYPEGCSFDTSYVSATGIDSYACGNSNNPCNSLAQAIYNRNIPVKENATIYVGSGEYNNTYISVSSMDLVILTSSESKPILSLVTPPVGLFCVYGNFMILLFSFDLLRWLTNDCCRY
jgi:hypothetical protein